MSFLWGYIQTKYFYEAVLGLKFWRIITIIAKYISWSFHSLKESTFSSYFIKRSFKIKAITKAAARKSILIYLRVIFHSSRTSQLICSVRKHVEIILKLVIGLVANLENVKSACLLILHNYSHQCPLQIICIRPNQFEKSKTCQDLLYW